MGRSHVRAGAAVQGGGSRAYRRALLGLRVVHPAYIENIVVTGSTFEETENGYSGLCPCEDLTYITTAGGPIFGSNLGYDYIRGIGAMLGVSSFREYRAENLDIVGNDVEKIMAEAVSAIERG